WGCRTGRPGFATPSRATRVIRTRSGVPWPGGCTGPARQSCCAVPRRWPALRAERAAGTVYLVGAGPGDTGLLSVRARELIAAADVILYDRLVPAEALDGARAGAELLYVGKEG